MTKQHIVTKQPKRLYRIGDIVGQKYHKLTVIKFLGMNRQGTSVWECHCDCGNKIPVCKTALTTTHKKNCGCSTYILKDRKEVALTQIYSQYKTNAKSRNLKFQLSINDVQSLIFENCYYCNQSPSNVYTTVTKDRVKVFYNGIDRIENNKGYIKNNCLPCCKNCNYLKRDLHVADFASHILKIVKHHGTWIK